VSFVPSTPHLFFTKNDPQDPRLGEFFTAMPSNSSDISANDVVVMGYPDDEGIRMNGGRPGAAEGPKLIRQFLYKMTWPHKTGSSQKFLDLGDLNPSDIIENKHEEALRLSESLHQKKALTLSFGGGHDYGYSDTAGFVKSYLNSKQRPLVINFDAHLDVRPIQHGPNSGTPFFRLLTRFSEQIDFVEIGLQPQCNSVFHREWAQSKKAFLYDLKDLNHGKLMDLFNKPPFKNLTSETPVYVSFDIDAITSSEAGGCSQSWVTGLRTQDCLDFLSELYRRSNCRGLGIYEVSPPLDTDFRTSKTAALIAYNFLFRP
jgi:formiminoglutamase